MIPLIAQRALEITRGGSAGGGARRETGDGEMVESNVTIKFQVASVATDDDLGAGNDDDATVPAGVTDTSGRIGSFQGLVVEIDSAHQRCCRVYQ